MVFSFPRHLSRALLTWFDFWYFREKACDILSCSVPPSAPIEESSHIFKRRALYIESGEKSGDCSKKYQIRG